MSLYERLVQAESLGLLNSEETAELAQLTATRADARRQVRLEASLTDRIKVAEVDAAPVYVRLALAPRLATDRMVFTTDARWSGGVPGGTKGNPFFAERTVNGRKLRYCFAFGRGVGFVSAEDAAAIAEAMVPAAAREGVRVTREGAELGNVVTLLGFDRDQEIAGLEAIIAGMDEEAGPLVACWYRSLASHATAPIAQKLRRWCARNGGLPDPSELLSGNLVDYQRKPLRPWSPEAPKAAE